ncbi:TlpA disulfide reductase family protein [Thalassotalea aquiviva]|uniref:TlpA disulfide reductase family protein n=1 Tax=Thalassotalea aquiviva TaxID=3242415 RepID=UPI00352A1661
MNPVNRTTIETISLVSLLLLSLLNTRPSFADHEKDNPSDGTVASFKKVEPPQYLQPVNFYDSKGEQVNFSQHLGKVLLVNVWATWCGPCLRELPELDRLQAKFKGAEFELLAISIDDEGLPIVEQFYQQLGIKNLHMYIDTDKQLGKIFPVDAVPATFIINRQGEVTSYLRSYANWDDEAAFKMVLDNIATPPYRLPELALLN